MWKQARLAEDFFVYIYNYLFEHREDYKELKRRENPEKKIKSFPVSKIIKDMYSYNDPIMQKCYKELLSCDIKMNKDFKPFISGNSSSIDKEGMFIFNDSKNNIFRIGTGGLHNDAPPGVWKETKERIIINVDATSFWPFIISTLKLGTQLYPAVS